MAVPADYSCVCCRLIVSSLPFFFFFNDTATTEIYTLSLHDALPISIEVAIRSDLDLRVAAAVLERRQPADFEFEADHEQDVRSEEHTSELQSLTNLVCRLLLEKKNIRTSRFVSDHTVCRILDSPLWA